MLGPVGHRPDQSGGRELPTRVLSVERSAGGGPSWPAPPFAPWAPDLWPPPHLPVSHSALFIPSSGPISQWPFLPENPQIGLRTLGRVW